MAEEQAGQEDVQVPTWEEHQALVGEVRELAEITRKVIVRMSMPAGPQAVMLMPILDRLDAMWKRLGDAPMDETGG